METLFRLYAKLYWQYRVWKLKFNLAKLERTLGHKSEWVLSYELCHMILLAIPRDMIQDVTRGFELNQEIGLCCTDLNHYQQSLVNVIDVFHAHVLYRNGEDRYGSLHLTRLKYNSEPRATTLGMFFVESDTIKSTVTLYDWLLEQLDRLMYMERFKHLKDVDVSYIDRTSHGVLQDMFTLCTIIAQVAIERDPPLYIP